MCKTRTGPQPPQAASYPGLPEERLLSGLIIIAAVVLALAVPHFRLSLPVPDASRRRVAETARQPARGLQCVQASGLHGLAVPYFRSHHW